MSDITKRRLAIVGGFLLLIAAYYTFQFLASQKEAPQRAQKPVRAKQVQVFEVTNSAIPTTVQVQGQLSAYDKVEIFSEVTGTLENTGRPFKVGTYFPKGSLMISLDDDEAALNVQAQKSTLLNAIAQMMPDLKIDYPESFPHWQAYLSGFDVNEDLVPLPEPKNDREKLFVASRNLYTQYYSIKSLEERLAKYRLYAPLSGVLTEVLTNPGAVVRANQKLGTLTATANYELMATVPVSLLSDIEVGSEVQLQSEDLGKEWTGKVRRISNIVDPNSQTVQVFIGVDGKDLREGMYLRGEVASKVVENAIRIDRDLLVNQRGVYVVQDTLLRNVPVEVITFDRDFAVIKGVNDGELLLSEPIPNAFDGMRVRIQQSKPKPAAVDTSGQAAQLGALQNQ